MSDSLERVRKSWDAKAQEWFVQVGDDGDLNRRLNSDPVLLRFVGDVRGKVVVDAGCGTGYLAAKLASMGATVIGTDISPKMIQFARERYPEVDFRVDARGELESIPDASVDVVVSNYVLMDAPLLSSAVRAMCRVLKPKGIAVIVISHPCFPQGRARVGERGQVNYAWDWPYFEEQEVADPPWAHFTTPFIWFHRPLSAYWRAFREAGFTVEDLEEPRISRERHRLAPDERVLRNAMERPYSIAFKLLKP